MAQRVSVMKGHYLNLLRMNRWLMDHSGDCRFVDFFKSGMDILMANSTPQKIPIHYIFIKPYITSVLFTSTTLVFAEIKL